MQHSHFAFQHSSEHHALLRAMKYLPIIAIGLLAVYEHSSGLLVILALGIGLSLAFKQRMDESGARASMVSASHTAHVAGDGGSFPGDRPMPDTPPKKHNTVIDGGSFEHHRGG
jgi:hypothetical protein